MEFDYFQNSISDDVLMASDTSAYLDADSLHLHPLHDPFHVLDYDHQRSRSSSSSNNINNPSTDFLGLPDHKPFPSFGNDTASTSNIAKGMVLYGGYQQHGATSQPPSSAAPHSLPDNFFLSRTSSTFHGVESFAGFRLQGRRDFDLPCRPLEKSIGRSYNHRPSAAMGCKGMAAMGKHNKKGHVIKGQWTLEEDK